MSHKSPSSPDGIDRNQQRESRKWPWGRKKPLSQNAKTPDSGNGKEQASQARQAEAADEAVRGQLATTNWSTNSRPTSQDQFDRQTHSFANVQSPWKANGSESALSASHRFKNMSVDDSKKVRTPDFTKPPSVKRGTEETFIAFGNVRPHTTDIDAPTYNSRQIPSPHYFEKHAANHTENTPPTPNPQLGVISHQPTELRPADQDDKDMKDPCSPTQEDLPEVEVTLLRQPDTRPITQEQLINEVKGIYAGLVMVEKKCVEICAQQSKTTNKLSNEQWQALIALHRTLLHEHHDFFLASQHPTASPALRRLATKYAMPARMWRHGIHSFLELLRRRLPDSLDHMLAFVYLAYSMMALLMESVPSFVETWIECLGDLARYRMAIEEADLRDREIWSNVARSWYNKAADRSPNVGRIQHHLAVLARPNIVQQLFYYSKALVSVTPFVNARDSIMLLFSPLLEKSEMTYQKYTLVESSLVTAAGYLFTRGSISDFTQQSRLFLDGLDGHIGRTGAKFKVQGPEMAFSLIAFWFDFGVEEGYIWKCTRSYMDLVRSRRPSSEEPEQIQHAIEDITIKETIRKEQWETLDQASSQMPRAPEALFIGADAVFTTTEAVVAAALPLWSQAISTVASRIGDKNIVPFMHVILANLWALAYVPGALPYVEHYVPWEKIATFLNTLGRSGVSDDRIQATAFPQPLSGTGRQLPEDFPARGLIWAQNYFPWDFFIGHVVDEDERTLELPSHGPPRAERCLWLGARLASLNRYLRYNVESQHFSITELAAALANATTHTFDAASRTASSPRDNFDDAEMIDVS